MWIDDGLSIILDGRREDWPEGARPLTPRAAGREPNGRTLWLGAELDPDGRCGSASARRPSGYRPDSSEIRRKALSSRGEGRPRARTGVRVEIHGKGSA